MKRYILTIALIVAIGCTVLFFPRPTKAEPVAIMPYSEHVVRDMFDLVRQSETLRAELFQASPEIARAALKESPNCLVCQAAALLRLRSYDENWADTIGECVDDDELDFCISNVLYNSCHSDQD